MSCDLSVSLLILSSAYSSLILLLSSQCSPCILQLHNFCLVIFMVSISFLNFSFCSCNIFLDSLNCLCLLSCGLWSFVRMAIWNWSARSQNSMPLNSVIGGLLVTLGDNMSHWFFMFLVVLCYCFCIWNSRHLLKSSLFAVRWEVLLVGPGISGIFSDLPWMHLFHTSCSLLWPNY